MSVVVAGGTVWTEDGPRRIDVGIEKGRIAALGALRDFGDAPHRVDATGLQVVPGLIDAHVHADDRIGGRQLADTWRSAASIALVNGITTLAGFATQENGETITAALDRCRARAASAACEVVFHLTPTAWPWDWDEVERLVGRGVTTLKLYTTYRDAGLFTPYDRLAEVMTRLARLGAALLVHCEDDGTLAAVETAGLDLTCPVSHCRLRPEAAELHAVRRVVALAERTGCRTHVVHVSTAAAAEVVAAARGRAPVTGETAPHYVLLDDRALQGPSGHRYLCTPPLRSEATRSRLESLAVAGALDLFATDHCAFRRHDKDAWGGDVRTAPCGLAGLGALVPLTFELLTTRHGLTLGDLVERLAANPARLLGLYPRKGVIRVGADADLAAVDPHGPERAIVSTLADAHETYPGRTTRWTVRHVLRCGDVVVRDGVLVAPARSAGSPSD